MPSVSAVAFWTAKRGNEEHEWEDNFALDEGSGRFAVADGASSSSKAAVWAAALTEGFLSDPFDVSQAAALDEWIERRCEQFRADHPATENEEVNAANWYAQAADGQDGFATLVTAQFGPAPQQVETLDYVGVGDACVFHVRGGELLGVAPSIGADGFGTFPDLISTNDDHRAQAVAKAFRGTTSVSVGDEVFLISDALAEWSLSVAELEPEVWNVLGQLDSETFPQLVDDLRSADEIVNDDVTLVRCRVER